MHLGQRRILWGTLFLSSLIISVLCYILFIPQFKSCVLFFPTSGYIEIKSELHHIPWCNSRTDEIRKTVEATLRGPLSMKFKRIVPAETALRALYVLNNRVYIDLTGSAQFPDRDSPLPIKERIRLISQAIRFNYPAISSVVILINGQEPGAYPYVPGRKS